MVPGGARRAAVRAGKLRYEWLAGVLPGSQCVGAGRALGGSAVNRVHRRRRGGFGGSAQVARESRFFREMVARQTVGVIGEPTRLEKCYTPTRGSTGSAPCRGDGPRTRPSQGGERHLAMIPFLAEMKVIHDETEREPAGATPTSSLPW